MILNIFIFLFAVFYLILAWHKLEWAVLLMIAALPAYLIRFSVGVPMTLLELMILISFAVWFFQKTNFKLFLQGKYGWKDFKENRLKRARYPWRFEIVAMLIISWLAIAVAGFTSGALGIWKAYFFEPILVFILILNLFRDKKGIEKIILVLAVSAFAVSVLAIYQKITGDFIANPFWAAAETRRSVSFFGYPNAVGLYLGPITMILAGYLFQLFTKQTESPITKHQFPNNNQIPNSNNQTGLKFGYWNLQKIFVALTIILSLLSIVFAKSEGAMLGLAAAFFVFGIFAGKKLRWATLATAIIIGGAILVYTPTRTFVLDKIQLHDLSGQIRRQQWKETWKMLNDGHFTFGAGLDNYQKTIKPYHQEGIFVYDFHDPNFHEKLVASDELKKKVWQPTEIYMYPHNIFLNFWSELGLLGMVLFIWIILKFSGFSFQVLVFKNSKNKYIILGLLCSMVVIVVHGLVDVPYFKNDLAVMFWLILAMLSLASSISKTTEK